MVKRIVTCLLSVVLLVSLFSGCSKGTKTTSGSDKAVTITFGLWDKNQEPTLRKIADKFQESHKNITVKIELTPWDQYWTKLETAATGGTLPDVFWMNGPNVAKYVAGKILLPLDDKIKNDSYNMGNYPKSLVDLYTVNGAKYGIPKGWDTIGLWYNKKLFDDAKVAYPDNTWDWNKLRETAKKLTDKSKGIYGIAAENANQTGYYNTILQSGGYMISQDKKKSGFDDPKSIAGVQCWLDLIKDGSSPNAQQMTDTAPLNLFESGKVAMYYAGSWSVSEFQNNEYTKDKVNVVEMPKMDKQATVIHGLGNVINAKTKNVDAAWEFVKFLGDKEANEMQAQAGIDIPAYQPALQIFIDSNKNFNLKAFTNELSYSVMYPSSQQTAKWQQVESDTMKKVWAGQMTAEEGCKYIAQEMNKILATEK